MKGNYKRILNIDTVNLVGKEVLLKGWIERVRTHGKLVFFDLRDRTALVQVVVNFRTSEEAYNTAIHLKPEDSIELIGIVNKRPDNAVNKEIKTGTIEIEAKEITVLSEAETLPFDTTKKRSKSGTSYFA